jgi:hypothetical protein
MYGKGNEKMGRRKWENGKMGREAEGRGKARYKVGARCKVQGRSKGRSKMVDRTEPPRSAGRTRRLVGIAVLKRGCVVGVSDGVGR